MNKPNRSHNSQFLHQQKENNKRYRPEAKNGFRTKPIKKK